MTAGWSGSCSLIVGCAAVVLLGCTSWHVERTVPLEDVLSRGPAEIRIAAANGPWVVIHAPYLEGDQLRGLASARRSYRAAGDSVHVPLSTVAQIATRHINAARTMAAVIVGSLGVAVFVHPWEVVGRGSIVPDSSW